MLPLPPPPPPPSSEAILPLPPRCRLAAGCAATIAKLLPVIFQKE
jgi:hypothetical protein